METKLQSTSPTAFYFVTGGPLAHRPAGGACCGWERPADRRAIATVKCCPPGPGNPQQACPKPHSHLLVSVACPDWTPAGVPHTLPTICYCK